MACSATSSDNIPAKSIHLNMDVDMKLCQKTTGQTDNDEWWKARQGRVTASNFGRVMSAKSDNVLHQLSQKIKAPPCQDAWTPPACRVGLMEEGNAKLAYINQQKELYGVTPTIKEVGLCVPNWNRSIGASPDGIVFNPIYDLPCVLVVKCLFDNAPLPRSILQIARDRGSSFYCTINSNGELKLKQNHQHYYQLQVEMADTGLLHCDFVIYHPRTKEINVQRFEFNVEVRNKMKTKLDNFCSNFLNSDFSDFNV